MKSEKDIKIERLYKILKEMEYQHRSDEAATLRWAIYQLENR